MAAALGPTVEKRTTTHEDLEARRDDSGTSCCIEKRHLLGLDLRGQT
eukprot:CAMPEP_0205925676 /NCGR_PEP_ID=MMETSP1325-20131115/18713_1 /ASSEMBLY_ACC=CAM_ASM_000708 /TAXON_ID=236786 /ORGANISM="Florenciella sp., Strain RCC1007" /LENGTH=46 /DNA_ID= /DNA_START= /DNA_END= /DNA_ORIENTATION=